MPVGVQPGSRGVIGDEALEPAHRHRLELHTERAQLLALLFLRADPAADGRQDVLRRQREPRALDVADRRLLEKRRDVDLDRAARDARPVRHWMQRSASSTAASRL
jgi:hypothetical protein